LSSTKISFQRLYLWGAAVPSLTSTTVLSVSLVLSVWTLSSYLRRKIGIPLIVYAAIMVGAYFVFPPNPDIITIPTDLIVSFRIASVFTVSIFWGLLGIILLR